MEKTETARGERVTERVWRCPDGVYRWYYELPMLKNPQILFTTWKVLGGLFALIWLIVVISSAASDRLYGWSGFLALTWGFILLTLAVAVISVFVYVAVAACFRWYYVVLFEMDDEEVRHLQVPRQFRRQQALAWLGLQAGLAEEDAASEPLLSAARCAGASAFEEVTRCTVRPRQGLILLKRKMDRNPIYAAPEDFDFIRATITERCAKAGRRQ